MPAPTQLNVAWQNHTTVLMGFLLILVHSPQCCLVITISFPNPLTFSLSLFNDYSMPSHLSSNCHTYSEPICFHPGSLKKYQLSNDSFHILSSPQTATSLHLPLLLLCKPLATAIHALGLIFFRPFEDIALAIFPLSPALSNFPF